MDIIFGGSTGAGALRNTHKIVTQCQYGWAPKNSGCQCTLLIKAYNFKVLPSWDGGRPSSDGIVQKVFVSFKLLPMVLFFYLDFHYSVHSQNSKEWCW